MQGGQNPQKSGQATPEGWEYEPDLRHAEAVSEDLGLEDARELSTPGVEAPKMSDEEAQDMLVALSALDATCFRGTSA